ncbi:C40 family peptidase [Anaerobacillus sp. MEB173]|uniref:C40 family peptidase n=1 Tax=Anaerobacillus sp. MEB173 TaxID=3383345 RepID=UPI003F935746
MKTTKIIISGLSYIGTPYQFGASPFQTKTFDCSSFVQHIYRLNGINLPRTSRQQYRVGQTIPRHSLKKGDLVFFTTKRRRHRKGSEKIGHVAVYIGQNKLLHTSRSHGKVAVTPFKKKWKKLFISAKRIVE